MDRRAGFASGCQRRLSIHAPPAPPDRERSAWDLRFRALVVGAWIQLLRRSGPSGLDDATAMLARLREERLTVEPIWVAAVEEAGDALASVRARFRLFTLAHVADAAVDTLLYLRHGHSHATAPDAERAMQQRLALAREAGAGDVQLDAVLTWLGEAARHVIARGSVHTGDRGRDVSAVGRLRPALRAPGRARAVRGRADAARATLRDVLDRLAR